MCTTPLMPDKDVDVFLSSLPGKVDEPPSFIPGKGGGPPPPLLGKGGVLPPPCSGKPGGPPPPPLGAMSSLSAKKATTKLKRSLNMGNSFRLLRAKMEGSTLVQKSSQGKNGALKNGGGNGGQSMADALAEMTKKSTYFQQIEEDVQKHGKSIKEIQIEISAFQTKDMNILLKFYQRVESKLDVLTDEGQV